VEIEPTGFKRENLMADGKATVNHSYEDWYKTIMGYERSYKRWEARVDRIIKKYKDDSRYDRNPNARFNILWSNVQTIQPAIFARLPRPDVSRRFRDNDPIGRVASMMLERALEFEIEHYGDYKSAMNNSVLDRLLGGRGVAWVRYEPHIVGEQADTEDMPEDGLEVTEDSDEAETMDAMDTEDSERIEYECCPVDYVHWKDFGHTIARTWEEVTAVWRKVYMSRPALCERFGEELGYQIPLDTQPDDLKQSYKTNDGVYEALIYEIWDKETGKVLWISKSLGKILDERDDPLGLENFWPCPKPLYSTLTTDSLEPIPDFVIYQDQARELDVLCDRIDGLINALKVRGVYDASASELQRLFSEGENNTMIPVHNWMAFAEKQGMKGAIDLVDLAPFASALMSCYQAMEQVKGQIYELMGIADIQRGQTDPNETLGAQIIKSNNAAGRLKTMQHSVVDFATSLLSIKAQIICNHFTDETLVKISGAMQLSDEDKQLIPQAIELLRDEASKNFRIEVTSDSMIYQDEQQEKADRVAFLAAVGSFMQSALPAAQASPELTPMLCEMLKFGVTAFKAGKQLEGIIDQTADDLRKQYEMSKGQPKPPPVEIQKAQMDSQAKMQQLQMTAQLEQAKLQGQMELEKAKQEYQAQENQLKFQLEAQRNQADLEMQARVAQMKMMTERNTQVLLAHINNGAKIETARISAGVDDGTEAYMTEESLAHAMEHPMQPIANAIGQGNQQMAQAISALVDTINAQHNRPKTVVRGQDGKIIGVQ
jgi:Skp family chaperone for outer membrane proteins